MNGNPVPQKLSPLNNNDERLSSRTFEWCAISGPTCIVGFVTLETSHTRDQLSEDILDRCIEVALRDDSPWDPFNVNVLFRSL